MRALVIDSYSNKLPITQLVKYSCLGGRLRVKDIGKQGTVSGEAGEQGGGVDLLPGASGIRCVCRYYFFPDDNLEENIEEKTKLSRLTLLLISW